MKSNAIDLNKIQREVLAIIRKYPAAADDEALLLERYWIEYDGWDESKSLYWNLSHVKRPETITRRRRELHNKHLIVYSKDSMERREEAFKNERERAATV